MNPRRIIIVGPSGGGKTTVGEAVARELGLPLFSMDSFRERGHRTQFFVQVGDQKVRNYEHPDLWDSNALVCKLRACIQADAGFVVEGNHLLYYPEIRALPITERYYLDVPFEVSVERRKTRHRSSAADESFALIGEAETKRWVTPPLAARGIVRLDGTQSTYATGHTIIHFKK